MAIVDTQQEAADQIAEETGIPYVNIVFMVIHEGGDENTRHYVVGCMNGNEVGRKSFVPLATNTGRFRVKKASDAHKSAGFESVY